MNAPQYPHRLAGTIRTDGGVDIAPCRRPNETEAQFNRRVAAEDEAHERLLKIGLSPEMSCGVGQYDGNGNPKGSGWW